MTEFRIGQGYDIHRLVENRKLILAGVEVPFDRGLEGHSDADVVAHALMDSLLGAAGMPDIGTHFPDTDPEYKDADSMKLLKEVMAVIRDKGYSIGNIDITIIAEFPKLSPHILSMKENIAEVLMIKSDKVSVKAATNEKLGPVGRGEGIAALAVALIYK
jgi:2-C-methyl-D-erythritol 2,4-cyclodiphosphate synthase